MRRFGRFAVVGWMGALVQFSVLWALTECGARARWAAAIAVEAAVLHNFAWHRRYTWAGRKIQAGRALVRFHAGNGAVSLLGNAGLMYLLVERWRLPLYPSTAAAIAVCSAANYALADRWVYAVACRCRTVSKAARALERNNVQDFS